MVAQVQWPTVADCRGGTNAGVLVGALHKVLEGRRIHESGFKMLRKSWHSQLCDVGDQAPHDGIR